MFASWYQPEKTIVAKVLRDGTIQHSKQAAISTMAPDGEKLWTDDRYKGGH